MAFRGGVQIDHNRDDDDDGFFKSKRNVAIAQSMAGKKGGGDRRHKKPVPGGHSIPGNDEDDYPSIGKSDPASQLPEGSEDSDGTTFEDEEGQSAGYTPEPTSEMPEDVEPKRPLRLNKERGERAGMTKPTEGAGGAVSGIGNPRRAMKGTGGHAKPPMGNRDRYNRLRDSSDSDSAATEGLAKSDRPTDGTAGSEGLPRSRDPMQDGTAISGVANIGSPEPSEGRTNPADPRTRTGIGNSKMAMRGTGGHAKPPLGSGGRFAQLKSKLAKRPGVTNPGALAAYIGRKKYGAAKMSQMAAHNR